LSTKARERVVVDTNALISRLLLPQSIPGKAVRKAVAEGQLLASNPTIMELADGLGHAKFDAYITTV
jgi:predicted nucleic acid-binding protein